MKTDFNFQRARQLFAIEMRLDMRKYALQLAIAFGILLVILCWITYLNNWGYISDYWYRDPLIEIEEVFFSIGFYIVLCFGTGLLCADLTTKPKRISAFMLPASQLEKFAVRWVIFVPMLVAAYVAGAIIVDWLRFLFALTLHPDYSDHVQMLLFHNDFTHNVWWGIFPAFALQSFFALGAAIWPKRGRVYTFIALGIIATLQWIIGTIFIICFMADRTFYKQEIDISWEPSETLMLTVFGIVCAIACAINYTIAYYRIKEMDLIDRW